MNVTMNMGEIIGGIIILIACVGIIIFVALQQSPKQGGLSALTGGSDSFFGQNKGRTKTAFLSKVTKILAVVLFVATVFVYAVS